MDKLIVTAGLTGSRISKKQTPHIPITPDEIVRSGVEAWRAGASVLHVHVRDPETGLRHAGPRRVRPGRRARCAPRPTPSSA